MDLAYLFVSSAASAVVRQPATVDALLRRYHSRLLGHLTPTQRDAFPFAALRQQYLISVADYTRFMAGWGFWGKSAGHLSQTAELLCPGLTF